MILKLITVCGIDSFLQGFNQNPETNLLPFRGRSVELQSINWVAQF